MEYFAHSLDGQPPQKWQRLEDHLTHVSALAGRFSRSFDGQDWARLAGQWHDLGKYSPEFQKMLLEANGFECHLETKPGKVVHSLAGGHQAQMTMKGGVDRILCWLVMGHHAGLTDYASDHIGAKALEPKTRQPEVSQSILDVVPAHIKNQAPPEPPPMLCDEPRGDVSFFVRMLFSCLVDADFLDTESFMDAQRKSLRQIETPKLPELLQAFDVFMKELPSGAPTTHVNRLRAEVLEQCCVAAKQEPQVFSLTVPTGGGKTLSSLAFGLRHAVRWNKKRIIYVIPYTSIIDQTAKVFREIPGFEQAVLEHHCQVLDDEKDQESLRSRLLTENWDAPIVVTTAVQFFESLYACKTSRCRKLHNIANSVVIFDEAQCLPPAYLRPIVYAIRELHRHYGVTPVLCTATQPVLTKTSSFNFKFKEGFDQVAEIIKNPLRLTKGLKRVRVETQNYLSPVTYSQLTEHLQAEGQSLLCIVNRKEDCRTLAEMLPPEQTIHLSTNMCADHRVELLSRIKTRIKTDTEPLYVISTSLVEAGVDLDFPVVYRALAGLDSIAQAAGRCNREGLLSQGKTVVFMPEKQPAYVQAAASLALEYLTPDNLLDVFSPHTFEHYFGQRFYHLGAAALDEKGILSLLTGHLDFAFRTATERFKLIDDTWQAPVIVPWGQSQALVDDLTPWNARQTFRQLQRFTVSVPARLRDTLLREGYAYALSEYPETCVVTTQALYSEKYGLLPPDNIDPYEVENFII